MKNLIEKLEEFNGCTLIYNLENKLFYTNGSIENFHYKTDGNNITLHEEKEAEIVAFSINSSSINEISDGGEYNFSIIFDDNTVLFLEFI